MPIRKSTALLDRCQWAQHAEGFEQRTCYAARVDAGHLLEHRPCSRLRLWHFTSCTGTSGSEPAAAAAAAAVSIAMACCNSCGSVICCLLLLCVLLHTRTSARPPVAGLHPTLPVPGILQLIHINQVTRLIAVAAARPCP
eukprot:365013-Chlamydomonas_euryale.AAC.12